MHRRFGLLGRWSQNSLLTIDHLPFGSVCSLNLLDIFIDVKLVIWISSKNSKRMFGAMVAHGFRHHLR
jgi:hypothetical protein